MGNFMHHVIVKFTYLGVKDLILALIPRVKCSSEQFTVAKSVFWLVDVGVMG
jgi:hypothetical protein